MDDLRVLLAFELELLLAVETELAILLPRLAADAADVQLREGIKRHAAETDQHRRNVETALRVAGKEPEGRRAGLEGMELQYRKELGALSTTPGELRDLTVTGRSASLEHLEIAGYEAALQKAELLGLDAAVELLEANLDDERRMLDEGEAIAHRLASRLARERLRA